MPQLEAGVLLLISAPRDSVYNAGRRDLAQENGQQACEIDVLAGKRGDVMQRRADWQKLLMAYEHARLMLCSGLERHMMKVAECEYKSLDILRSELQEWTIFGCMQQDSLIGERGPYSHVDASWQGQVRLSDLVASQSQHLLTGRVGAVRSSEAR